MTRYRRRFEHWFAIAMDKALGASANDVVREHFRTLQYIRHNQRRQEHLASIGLDLAGRSVLELGAGIGDHTTFFLDRGCRVVSLEARPENCEVFELNLRSAGYRRPVDHTLVQGDIADLDRLVSESFDVVYCYGLLYHVEDPAAALAAMARRCGGILLLETSVSYGDEEAVYPAEDIASMPSHSIHGTGCRPTRPWVFSRLKELFPHVYLPCTQPAHEEFPTDWQAPGDPDLQSRAVFVAARSPIENSLLLDRLPMRQERG